MNGGAGYVWLASYPKSGNTWLRLLLQSCLAGGAHSAINKLEIGGQPELDRDLFDEYIGVPASDLTEEEQFAWRPAALRGQAARLKGPLYAKTHSAQLQLPNGERPHPPDVSLGAIVLVRDPRDVASSLARQLGIDVDAAISVMADPEFRVWRSVTRLHASLAGRWSSWTAHAESWLDAAGMPTCLVRYEDLKDDPARVLADLAAWLGEPATAQAIHGAVRETRIETLRAEEAAEGFREWRGKGRFFGEARAGAWRERLTQAQSRRIESDQAPMMRRLGYLR